MAELASWVSAAISAGVSVVAGVVSVVAWIRAKGEREEAARQAKAATDAATASARHLARIADVQTGHQETVKARMIAEERDPWQLERGHNEAIFYNDTATPKYDVQIEIKAGDNPWDDDAFEHVGPRRNVSVDYTAVGGPMSATVTWHLSEDCSDARQVQTFEW